MAKSALLKSSLAKKYWMALTGLFLCVFLVGHLAGNLQLIFGDALQFNQYALFMTTNPAVKALSYLTYISIIFHSVDGILLAYQNNKARPIKYAKENAASNSPWASRNMAILGTAILIFIVTHMITFWAPMHYDEKMPLQEITVQTPAGPTQLYHTVAGSFAEKSQVQVRNRTEFFHPQLGLKIGEGYKDLHKITFDFFKDPTFGLLYTILYVISMIVLGFHLHHGFGSAFQSMGVNHPKYTPFIKKFGKAFAIIIPFLFAVIPVYVHFSDQIHSLLA
ncbi:MAG TPA: succinate dehydrogenase cytochrome b subunit [Flavobacterium sp.]|jgi:succinate dehydrogenase / fumarate reductase cytochrome b subunit|nr:succinate dehydrogenase cytochrome b subunit [Flavobacterium sp.]